MSRARAWGWIAHLRDGGTTPWADWSAPADRADRVLPGAQQLELLRRLNLAGRPSTALADRVLATSAPGRGRPDFELVGADEGSPFGPQPVDPSSLPADELVRVATGVIAEDVVAGPVPERTPRRPRRPRWRIVGDAWVAHTMTEAMLDRRRWPGGPGTVAHVVGTDQAAMLVDAWTARCFAEGGPPWGEWLDAVLRRPVPPRRADLVRVADAWAGRLGRSRVRVVLDPALVAGLVRTRRPLPVRPTLPAAGVELARHVSAALGHHVVPARRVALLRGVLLPRLVGRPGPALVVPPDRAEQVTAMAERHRERLLAAHYAVHGEPDLLLPRQHDGAAEPAVDGVLDLALALLLDHQTAPEEAHP
ncbi:hypothetical protein [Nocardioides sp. SYSU D00038]|uniref:hypothetical protein n=1 Tax=Nocardioides sp. SYSU D00038 TaxID=2812554 RepID=UPI0019679810|nr:hypothetical protein [Nocardioides sp. SYSU D00038]